MNENKNKFCKLCAPCGFTQTKFLRPDGGYLDFFTNNQCGTCTARVNFVDGEPFIGETNFRGYCWVPEKDRKNFTVSVL